MKEFPLQLLLRHLYGLLLGAFLGILIGQFLWTLLFTTILMLVWHIYNLGRLAAWTGSHKKLDIPTSRGIWGQVFDDLYNRQQRHNQRKKTLSKTLKRFVKATAALPDGTVVLDDGGYIEWCNPSARQLLGLRWPKDGGQRLDNLIRHPNFLSFYERKSQNENDGVEIPSPVDTSKILFIQIVPYGNSRLLVIARDITLLKRLENMRRNFISNVSHELKTPLTVINGYLEILEAEIEPDSKASQPVTIMQRQTARMVSIVEDLITLSKLETGEQPENQTWINVCHLIEEVVSDAMQLSNGDHHIESHLDESVTLLANPQEIRSAFSNLVFNAVRYTQAGGRVDVNWERTEKGAQFKVSDNGPGIPTNHLPRLTERFYRVDVGRSRHKGGTGLGLAIVKHILIRHDAGLQIDSVVGEGSQFSCCFPVERVQFVQQEKND